MNKKNNYFLLSAVFIGMFLLIQFTDIYGNSTWFKAFLLILGFSFLFGGITQKKE